MKITRILAYRVEQPCLTYEECLVAMTLEDSWGGEIATAANAHLAQSTPTEFLFTTPDFNSYVTVSTATGAPQRVNGRMAASTAQGLGITPKMDVFGPPVVSVSHMLPSERLNN